MGERRENHAGTRPRRRKDGRYVVQVMLAGKRHAVYGASAEAARKKAKALVRAHESGVDLGGASTPLAEFLTNWLRTVVKRRREGTYLSYETAVRVHILPHPARRPLGELPIGKIRPADIEEWIADRHAAGLAPYTVWRLHAVLRAGLNRAVKGDPPILVRNPASVVDAVEHDQDEIQPLSAAQARLVLAATADTPDHAFYAVALSLGLRQGELLGLRWASGANDPGVDLDRGEVRVYQQLQRGRLAPLKRTWHRRILPLSPWLVAVLERHGQLLAVQRQLAGQKWREQGLVFPTRFGTPQRAGNNWRSWKRLQQRLELGEHTVHDLRHTCATLALQAGLPLWKVSKMLGHRDIAITLRVYGHLTPEGREDVAQRMEQVLGPQVQTTAVELRSADGAGQPERIDFEIAGALLGAPGGE